MAKSLSLQVKEARGRVEELTGQLAELTTERDELTELLDALSLICICHGLVIELAHNLPLPPPGHCKECL